MVALCQRTPRGVSVSGWVHGTVSWTVTVNRASRGLNGGANGVGACTAAASPGQYRTPYCHSRVIARRGSGSTLGPCAPSKREIGTASWRERVYVSGGV